MPVLSGKTALVTGSSRGIGRAIALRLAQEGALVVVHYNSGADAAARVVAEIESAGGRAFAVCADLSSTDAIGPLFAAIDAGLAARGAAGLDILVNNAAIGMARDLFTLTPDEFDRVMAVDAKVPLFVAQAAARRMGAGGRIINISSMVVDRVHGGRSLAYGMAKAALGYMTRAMAASLGPRGITANAVAPGWTATEMTRDRLDDEGFAAAVRADSALRRVGEADDVARAVALLAGPDSQWVTGELVRASGGLLL
jgi:3-oxoacyl-[acyl-carrier protein] reductase